MGRLILVRHGESEANRDGCFTAHDEVPLTEQGMQQASRQAARIAELYAPVAVAASKFLRARQTAGIIAEQLHLPVEVLPDLHERDFGCLRGAPYDALRAMIESDPSYDSKQDWLWAPQGGESRDDVRKRVVPAFQAIANRHPDGDVVVVSHGVVMLALWAYLTGTWTDAHLPPNCGIILVKHDRGQLGTPTAVSD